jgi:hypothetical protein
LSSALLRSSSLSIHLFLPRATNLNRKKTQCNEWFQRAFFKPELPFAKGKFCAKMPLMKAMPRLGTIAGLLLIMSFAPAMAESMPMRTLAQGAFGGIQLPKREVIKDAAAWEKLWAQHAAPTRGGERPQVDFSKEMVILVTMGRQTTGGYAIEITKVEPDREHLRIMIKRTSPPPDAMTIQALTAPFHIVAVPRSDLEPRFIEGKLPERK